MSLASPSTFNEQFLDQLQENFEASLQDDTLASWRSRAWDRFMEIGLPTTRTEAYRNIPLRRLYQSEFQLAERPLADVEDISSWVFPSCRNSFLVFVDGFFVSSLSDISSIENQLVISSIPEAMQNYGVYMQNHWNAVLSEEKEPFSLLNMALHTDGVFLYLPPGKKLSKPLQILHITTSSPSPRIISPRVQLFLGKGASMDLFHFAVHNGQVSDWCNQTWGFSLDQNAQLGFFDCATFSENRLHTNHVRVRQKKDSQFKAFSFSEGSKLVRNDYQSILSETGAHVDLQGLWATNDRNENHTHICITHAAEHCTSKQFFKGILNDESRASFEGKIYVESIAQKTEAYQLNRNLLLSNDAKILSKPNLEIFADDVKASHGSTVTQISQESLLYLLSRGINQTQAKNLLTQAFWKEFTGNIPKNDYQKWVENRCREIYSHERV